MECAALKAADRENDVIVMAEVRDEACYVPHHPKKIVFIFSAMRHFAAALGEAGWTVEYTRYDAATPHSSIVGALLDASAKHNIFEVLATEPGEWRLIDALIDAPLQITVLEDDRFVSSHSDFRSWAEGRKELRMEWFYRGMRKKTGILMEGDKPAGGKWNFDHDNRKPAKSTLDAMPPLAFENDQITQEVLSLVESEFSKNFGELRPFNLATTRSDALKALDHFIEHNLPKFGDYQDAMVKGEKFLWHSLLSPYLNIGLLGPLEVCHAAEEAWKRGAAPLNAVEGFVRQIIGWREYVRGIYFLSGREYTQRNALDHQRQLPAMYWGSKTQMTCMAEAIGQTHSEAYAHHIQRLMVTGNFALLAGVHAHELHEWYLSVYIDAFEWVESPNTIGMSQYADGGVVASKPYVSSGAYISRMSDYCGSCHYDVKAKTGSTACPFNALYWHFLTRHRDKFSNNMRMGNMYRTWDRMAPDAKTEILSHAEAVLEKLDAGEVV